MKAKKFDAGKDVTQELGLTKAGRVTQEPKTWLAERLERTHSKKSELR